MRISKSTNIKAPVQAVWRLIGTEFTDVGNWASGVYHSSAKTGMSKVASAPAAGRTCETTLGPFSEEIVAYSDSDMRIAYSVSGDKMPGFMKSTVAEWSIKESSGGVSTATMTMTADVAQPFAFLMGWMIKKQFTTAIIETMDDLKIFAETGQKSDRKIKAEKSKKGIDAKRRVMSAT